VRGEERIVEIAGPGAELEPGSANRLPALELVNGDVNAAVVQLLQGSFDALERYQPLRVRKAYARMIQQLSIGTPRILVDAALQDLKKGLLPISELVVDEPEALRFAQSAVEELSEAAGVTGEPLHRLEHAHLSFSL
jgi:hypothetical protein